MGRLVLICRLAARDLRRRPGEAVLLLLAIVAATTTLTLGLLLHGVTSHPYDTTRAETAGPDVVANVTPLPDGKPADITALRALTRAHGVAGHSGPYPLIQGVVRRDGHVAAVQLEGRDSAAASVDQPKLTDGSWIRQGGVVVERSFADAFDLHTGDRITVNGRPFRVLGLAVTAAMSPYPETFCLTPCALGAQPSPNGPAAPHAPEAHPGLIWLTRGDLSSLGPQPSGLSYVANLKLADPAAAPAFANDHTSASFSAPSLEAWQGLSQDDSNLVRNEQRALLTGSLLLSLLALASIAVLVGGRMADQIRRVGLLKAVGGTPKLIAAVLLAEYMALALIAAALGLAIGWPAAPLLTSPGAGLIGSAGSVRITTSTVEVVVAVALAVAAVATFVPALRASRTSTVLALADSARPPRRMRWLIRFSARLPVPLMLGLRVAARRPRRTALCVLSVAITVTGIVAVLAAHAQLSAQQVVGSSGLSNPRADRLNQVLLVITVMLIALAAVNAVFITWATVLDARHSSALERALGATPQEVSSGLSAAQVLPALAGAIPGIPGGILLFNAVSPTKSAHVPPGWILAVLVATPLVIALLTAIPARLGGRRAVAEILQAELA
jgi:ABC-type lipoprotein release transport system permease subunit